MRLKNFTQCHLLFISGLDRSTVLQLLNEIKNQPILTVSDDDNHFLVDSGMVVFKVLEGKVNIEINLNAVKLAGLEISSRVLKLATIFNP
ncbi:MAG: YfiR family protein [Methylococcaceae bacterium]|nr:YfiR family protein [Methylococcaceae bacterium]